jgi:hypothetical protein
VPEATAVPFLDAFAAAGVTEVLAGEPGADEVDACGVLPADGGDVAEVRHARVAMCEDLGRVGVEFGVPGDLTAEHLLHGHVKTAIAGAHRADPERHGVTALSVAW